MIESICICGGGSLGTVCAGVFLSQGVKVNLLTGHPHQWNKEIEVTDENGKVFSGELSKISNKPEDVIPEAEIILLCLPGYLIKETLIRIKTFLKKNVLIGSIVSSTGFFFISHEILDKNATLFGFQRVPYIARYREYGKSADLLGYKKVLKIAIENGDKEKIRQQIESLFLTPVSLVNSYYEVSLSNSNPILHTGRLYSLWGEKPISPTKDPIKFYSDWTDESSEIVLAMDEEFMVLIKKLGLETSIPSLKEYYEVTDATSLTKKIKSIPAFQNILAPMKERREGWFPDFSNRYFKEDFPFGLKFIKESANIHNIKIPQIAKVSSWGEKILSKNNF